ncbi:MAG: DUF1015 domain-containing protein [Deltaproteobacteria bacterium]|jgi:uncharacterized protein (DUF1015 family)|nr:DUF1015 domain-containing protein [Deltaproteobacteria bacterium]
MAEVIPFKGILYNTGKITDLADVVAPPFDVISEQEQIQFYKRHPQNIIRLTLGKITENDTPADNRYTRAAECLNRWLLDDIVLLDKEPAFYLTSIEFLFEGNRVTRYGLISLIRLEPFEKGIILPHEKTFSRVKSDRLELMKACHANFSPIFSLFSDEDNRIYNKLKFAILDKSADIVFTDKNDQKHRLWRITDNSVHQYISDALKDKKIFIADGHHRYETALNYRDWLSSRTSNFNGNHPANYVMMYLCSMEDPGLIILPAHRMLKEVPTEARESLVRKTEDYFDIITIPYHNDQHKENLSQFISILKSNTSKHCIGVCMKDRLELYLLILKPNVMENMFGGELSEVLRNIDVTVLTRLIFMEVLGFDQARLDNERLIGYSSIAEEAIDGVYAGKYDIAFILNPTRIQQVRDIANAGLIMPRKATYFFPKVITGQVMNRLY